METPLQIVMRHIEHSDALEASIRENVARLESFHPHIIGCRVAVEPLRRHDRRGHAFQVRIDVRVPGKEYVATRKHETDVLLALHEAYHAARRQIEEDIRQKRGAVKQHAPRPTSEENGA
jgi:ribosome-associated translation inhibitor RaiA